MEREGEGRGGAREIRGGRRKKKEKKDRPGKHYRDGAIRYDRDGH